jgi:ferric-dicitrate binding protein FerR (iron transport regulator)
MPDEKKLCSETVYPRDRYGSFHGYPCTKKVTVERDGKPYCSIHDPEAVKARDAARRKKWDEESEAKQRAWDRERKIRGMFDGIPTEEIDNYTLVRKSE